MSGGESSEQIMEEIQKQCSKSNSLFSRMREAQELLYVNFEISVIDNGVGMSKEGVKKLFIDFNKLDENAQRNKSGTGLGLSICKRIIE
jgi:signal transduction histidine kinase